MIVDRKSLTDLGILPSPAGDWPLRTILDHTHCVRGGKALENLLATPLDDAIAIRARQRVLAGLRNQLENFSWTDCVRTAFEVESFLSSNFVNCPENPIEFAIFVVRYRDIATFVENGARKVAELCELCRWLADTLNAFDDCAFLALRESLRTVGDDPLRQDLRTAIAAKSKRAVCVLDQRMRISRRDMLLRAIEALRMLDAFHSLSVAANQNAFVLPTIVESGEASLSLRQFRHPLVAGSVANDFELIQSERVAFMTGPNMAGKSTTMRAIGIVVVFAHLGLPVPAQQAVVPRADRLIASLNVEDNVMRGESLYLAEVRRVKTVVAAVASGETVVALLDEIFRGTNTHDAGDATTLVVHGLAKAREGVFLVASHLVEIVPALSAIGGVGFWRMQVLVHGDRYEFPYRLERGTSAVRLGMALLESEGVTELVDQIRSNFPISSRTRGPT